MPLPEHGAAQLDRAWSRSSLQEEKLLRAAQRGDSEARRRLVEQKLDAVRSMAGRYCNLGLPFDDLAQEGAIGLLEAIAGFDPDRGASFDTYARLCMRRAITRALTDRGRLVRMPKNLVERRRAVLHARSELAAASGREVSALEVAEMTGLPVDSVAEADGPVTAVVSLDAPVAEDGTTLEALVRDRAAREPETQVLSYERRRVVREALSRLKPRQRYVISGHYGIDRDARSFTQIGDELGISPQRVRSLEQQGLRELAMVLGAGERRGAPPAGNYGLRTVAAPMRPRGARASVGARTKGARP